MLQFASLVYLVDLKKTPPNQSLTPSISSSICERHSGICCIHNQWIELVQCLSLRSKRSRAMDVLFYYVLAGSNWSASKTINEAGPGWWGGFKNAFHFINSEPFVRKDERYIQNSESIRLFGKRLKKFLLS